MIDKDITTSISKIFSKIRGCIENLTINKGKEMPICNWHDNNGYVCGRPIWNNEEHCLFHKPNKNPTESLIFHSVVNIDFFKYMKEEDI